MAKPEPTLDSLLHELCIKPGYDLTYEIKCLINLDEVIRAELKGRNRWNSSFWDFITEVEWRVSCGEMPPVMAELVELLKPCRERHVRYLAKKGSFDESDALKAWVIHDYCEEKLEECERKSAGKQWDERNAYRLQQGLYPLENIYAKPGTRRFIPSSYASSTDDELEPETIGRYTSTNWEPVRPARIVHQRHDTYNITAGFEHYASRGDISDRLHRRLNGFGNSAQLTYAVPIFRIPRLRSDNIGRLFESNSCATHGYISDQHNFEVNQNRDFFEPRTTRGAYTSGARQQPGGSHYCMGNGYSTQGYAHEDENGVRPIYYGRYGSSRDIYANTMNDSGHIIRSSNNETYPVLFGSDGLAYVRTSDPDTLCYILNR